MDIIGILSATELNLIGKLIYNVLYKWVSGWTENWGVFSAFSVTVIMFTLFLKIVTSPFDVWQKAITRKNAKIMEFMKPELDKMNKQYAGNKELLMQKQREIYKKHKYSTFASCLPMIITLVIFFIIFGGFNSAVKYQNSSEFDTLSGVYDTAYAGETAKIVEEGLAYYNEEGALLAKEGVNSADIRARQVAAAEAAVVEAYEPQGFLLTKNIFMPDTWKSPIPDASTFSSTGMGKLGITGIDSEKYETVMKPLIEKYNLNEKGKKAWNGYLILPILAFGLNLLSTKLNKQPQQPQVAGQTAEQAKAQENQMKMMTYLMPFMMVIFALFYSSAFTLYMLLNSGITTAFNFIYNIVAKKKDEEEKERILSTTKRAKTK